MKHELLSTGDVRRILGISVPTLNRWIQQGRINPAKRSRGSGDHNVFSRSDVLAIALMQELDRRGVHRDAVSAVAEFVRTQDLDLAFASGQRFLVCYGKHVYRQLVRQEGLGETLLATAKTNKQFRWEDCKVIDVQGALDAVHRMIDAAQQAGAGETNTEALSISE